MYIERNALQGTSEGVAEAACVRRNSAGYSFRSSPPAGLGETGYILRISLCVVFANLLVNKEWL